MSQSKPLILRLSHQPKTYPHLKWHSECLKTIGSIQKIGRKPSDRAFGTRELISTLASSTPELSESEFNDSLGAYLSMLEQHDHQYQTCRREQKPKILENGRGHSC